MAPTLAQVRSFPEGHFSRRAEPRRVAGSCELRRTGGPARPEVPRAGCRLLILRWRLKVWQAGATPAKATTLRDAFRSMLGPAINVMSSSGIACGDAPAATSPRIATQPKHTEVCVVGCRRAALLGGDHRPGGEHPPDGQVRRRVAGKRPASALCGPPWARPPGRGGPAGWTGAAMDHRQVPCGSVV